MSIMTNLTVRSGDNKKLASIYVGRKPNHSILFKDCILYLSHLTNTPIVEIMQNYHFLAGTKIDTGALGITDGTLGAGHYIIHPKSELTPQLTTIPITTQPTLSPPRSTCTDNKDLSPEDMKHYAHFRFSLGLRGRRCIASGNADPEVLVGTHIIPHSWKNCSYIGLPTDITDTLTFTYDEMGVDDIRNGALMESSIHTAFNLQYWSVVWEEDVGKWRIVAISKEAPKHIIGKYLIMPDPGDAETPLRYEDMFINPRFLQYHLQTAVLRHMRGGGGPDDEIDKPLADLIKGETKQKTTALRCINLTKVAKPEDVRAVAWDIVEQHETRYIEFEECGWADEVLDKDGEVLDKDMVVVGSLLGLLGSGAWLAKNVWGVGKVRFPDEVEDPNAVPVSLSTKGEGTAQVASASSLRATLAAEDGWDDSLDEDLLETCW
ncbi:hypothetical protein HDV00_007093 [Rhizophlyctis rosea]|nr:hypothetical protein HDV00_007093 [Rhizophlyctis rosea]